MSARSQESHFDYDVALSYAGEDRKYVEAVARILHELGVRVFYDRYETTELWGKDLYTQLDDVYRNRSEFCVIFISTSYKEKLWTNHERRSAQARALAGDKEYILPARFDGTELPGLPDTIAYLDLQNISPDDLANILLVKIGRRDEISEMIEYLAPRLPDYEITLKGSHLTFDCPPESFYSEFPVRLMLEMYRLDLLERMFVLPAIVPN